MIVEYGADELQWGHLKTYIRDIGECDILKSTVRFQEHHTHRYLKFYPYLDLISDKPSLILSWPTTKELHLRIEELQLLQQYGNNRLTWNDLKIAFSKEMPDTFWKSPVFVKLITEVEQPIREESMVALPCIFFAKNINDSYEDDGPLEIENQPYIASII